MPLTTALCIALSLSCYLTLSGLLWSRAAYAEDFNPAESVYDTIVGNSVSWGQQRWLVAEDLAWRYYQADPSLRDVQPLVPAYPNVGRLSDYSDYEEWRVNAIANGFMVTFPYNFNDLDGNAQWDVNTPNHEIEYEKWYNYYEGITSGGGSGGESALDGQYVYLGAGTGLVRTGRNSTSQSSYADASSFNGRLSLSQSQVSRVESNQYAVAVMVNFGYNSTTNIPLRSYIFTSDSPISANVSTSASAYGFGNYYTINVTGSNFTYCYYNDSYPNNVGPDTTDGYITGYVKYGSETTGSSFQITDASAYWLVDVNNPSGGGGNQPTEPVYPTPYQPATPEPPTSPPDNNPTNVNIGGNTYNNNTGTTNADLTPLLEMLRIINSNIIEFETGFNNYANKVQEYLSNIYDMVYGFLQNIQDEIDDYGRLILEELREANQWLAYIFYSLGQGGGSQPDPVVKPDDWWSWLGNLADGLLGDLPTELTALTGTMQALRSVFPFSLPWDLGVLLGLFVATPVTPVLDIPFGYSANGITYIHVDCSAWNNVMATVRSIELVAFAAGLAFKTRDLLKVVEV